MIILCPLLIVAVGIYFYVKKLMQQRFTTVASSSVQSAQTQIVSDFMVIALPSISTIVLVISYFANQPSRVSDVSLRCTEMD